MQYELMLENTRLPGINPLICGRERCRPGHSFGPAERAYILLHYVLKGRGVLHNSRGAHPVRQGQIFVIRPGETTVYTADNAAPWEYIWVGFESTLDLQGALYADVLDAPGCGAVFTDMLENALGAGQEWFICGKVYQLLALLARPAENESGSARYVQLAKDYINANYMQEVTVAGMAQNLGLERSYFSRLFRQHTGKPPQEYLVDYRLEKAAALLLEGRATVGQAAALVGYTDAVNFSRMFRRRYGVSPTAYAGKPRK